MLMTIISPLCCLSISVSPGAIHLTPICCDGAALWALGEDCDDQGELQDANCAGGGLADKGVCMCTAEHPQIRQSNKIPQYSPGLKCFAWGLTFEDIFYFFFFTCLVSLLRVCG